MTIDWKVEKLKREHGVEGFDCGKEPLNRFLIRNALQSQQANASQTYVLVLENRIVGYHTLVVGEVAHADAPERAKKGLAQHPIPIMLLARLAVAQDWQKKGIGPALLKDALLRTLQAADIVGIRGFVVHAKDDQARSFYEHFDFVASPTDPMHLFLLTKDIKALLR
jgi:GNAT superfamily N-acetyltransferase